MLKRFECLTLDGIGKRVYQLKDMTTKFADNVFPGWYIHICYLPAGRSVLEKYFVEVSKTTRDRRSRDVFETSTKYFSVRTDLNGK